MSHVNAVALADNLRFHAKVFMEADASCQLHHVMAGRFNDADDANRTIVAWNDLVAAAKAFAETAETLIPVRSVGTPLVFDETAKPLDAAPRILGKEDGR